MTCRGLTDKERLACLNFGIGTDELQRIEAAIAENRGWFDLKLASGKCSFGFEVEFAILQVRRLLNTFAILDTVEVVEKGRRGVGGAKGPTPFRHAPLLGLWHAHFFDASFMVRNLLNEATDRRVRRFLEPHLGADLSTIAGEFAHHMVIGAYEDRARKNALTGEWVVYDPSSGANYFLTVASHTEADTAIFERIEIYRKLDVWLHQPEAEGPRR